MAFFAALPLSAIPAALVEVTTMAIAFVSLAILGHTAALLAGWMVDNDSCTPIFFGCGVLTLVCASILWLCAGSMQRPL